MALTTFQWFSSESDWYLLTTPSEYATSDLVHVMACMIDPTTEAYGTLFMHSLFRSCRTILLREKNSMAYRKIVLFGILHAESVQHSIYVRGLG